MIRSRRALFLRLAALLAAALLTTTTVTAAPASAPAAESLPAAAHARAASAHAGAARVGAQVYVRGLTFARRPNGKGYVVRVRTSGRIEAYGKPRTTRGGTVVEWKLFHTRLGKGFATPDPRGPVTRIATRADGRHLVLRFEMDDAQPVTATAYRDRASSDLLLSLAYAEGAAPPARTSGEPAAGVAPVPSAEAVEGAARTDARLATARQRWRLDTVVIDAGHGGKDPGTQGYGLKEKDIVLAVALKLGHYLEDRLGLHVVYTRTDDTFIELEERGRIANEAEAKLFISIHANATRSRRVAGTETFFLGRHKTDTARDVMERENSVINLEDDPSHYDGFGEFAVVQQTLAQSAYMRQSQQLASLIEDQFAERVHRHSRGVKQAGFIVLWAASMPAVLVELGFLTNHREGRFLQSEEGQDYMASALFRAIRAYKEEYERGMNGPAASRE
jgi:N-acetylmuramoyl-L-alanine amidase